MRSAILTDQMQDDNHERVVVKHSGLKWETSPETANQSPEVQSVIHILI